MNEGVTLVITTGVQGNSQPEIILNRALEANTLDLLETADSIPEFDRKILISNSQRLINTSTRKHRNLITEHSTNNFHFGNALFDLIKSHDIENLLYLGGGSGPLFEREDLKKIASFLADTTGKLIANNFYSSDMLGISPAQDLLKVDPPEKDNQLGWLARDAGFEPHEMTRNAKTQLDLDTPADLIPLKISDRARGRLKDFLPSEGFENTKISDILPQFTDQNSRLIIGGRLGASTWSFIEKYAACHIDVISEGRGSYTSNDNGDSGSLWLGKSLQELGPDSLIQFLGEKGTGLFLDTRVLFDFLGEWPSRKDRFSSDLLRPSEISVDYLRNLTRAARDYPKPVVLGGHSMISGSLYLLTDVAWELNEPKSVNIRPNSFKV